MDALTEKIKDIADHLDTLGDELFDIIPPIYKEYGKDFGITDRFMIMENMINDYLTFVEQIRDERMEKYGC